MMTDVVSYFKSLSKELEAQKDRVRNFIGNHHWLSDGEWKEGVLRSVIASRLPDSVKIGRGFVLTEEEISTQCDVILYKSDYPVLFRDGGFVILPTEAVLGIKSEDHAWWQDVLKNIAPYAVDKTGFQLMRGVPLTESHRTFPQLLPIYPYGEVHVEGTSEDRELIRRSFSNVTDRGTGKWAGYC